MNQQDALDQQALDHAKAHMGDFAWPTLLFGVAVCGAYFATIALALLGLVPLIVAFPVVAVLTYLAYTVLHESVHGSISGSSKSLRWVNETLGYTAAWILMLPLTAHRHEHLAHHRHTNEENADPDYEVGNLGKSLKQLAVIPWTIFAGQFTYFTTHRWAKSQGRQNLYFCLEITAAILPRVALAAAGFWLEALALFVLAWWLGLMITLYLFAYLVHRPHDEVGRYVDTSTFVANGLFGKLLTVIFVCQNYHAIHHLFPRVPFYRYPALFRKIESIMAQKGAPIVRLSEQAEPTWYGIFRLLAPQRIGR